MRRRVGRVAVIVATLLLVPVTYAQKATEQYIPVGKSPGISGKYSYIGEIEQVDQQNRTITVAGPEGRRTIKVTDATKIWLDRTQQRISNKRGSMADCQPGRRVEVNYVDYETKDQAEWIKVMITER